MESPQRAAVVVLYHHPADPAAFDGSKPAYYRKAELWIDSDADLRKGIATAGFETC